MFVVAVSWGSIFIVIFSDVDAVHHALVITSIVVQIEVLLPAPRAPKPAGKTGLETALKGTAHKIAAHSILPRVGATCVHEFSN